VDIQIETTTAVGLEVMGSLSSSGLLLGEVLLVRAVVHISITER